MMASVLQISAGTGPLEVRCFVGQLAAALEQLCLARGEVVSSVVVNGDEEAPRSVELFLARDDDAVLADLLGTHVLIASSVRRGRRSRKRWFAGVSLHAHPKAPATAPAVAPSEVQVSIARAGGPGGQHVNTTDSAVRVRHIPTGICIRVASERSQHQNRNAAMRRLADVLHRRAELERARSGRSRRAAHYHFERGSAVCVWQLDVLRGLVRV